MQKVPFLSHFYKFRGWGYTCLRPHPSSMVELEFGLGPCPNHESTLLSNDRESIDRDGAEVGAWVEYKITLEINKSADIQPKHLHWLVSSLS